MLQPLPSASSNDLVVQAEKKTTTSEKGTAVPEKPGEPKSTSADKEVTEVEAKPISPDTSLLGRTLDNDAAIILFRLGVALFAGFIVGLIVQRIGLGKYAFKFGPIDIAEVSSEKAQAELSDSKLGKTAEALAEAGDGSSPVANAPTPKAGVLALGGELETALRARAEEIPDLDARSAPLPLVIERVGQAYDLDPGSRAALHEVIDLSDQVEEGAKIGSGTGRWLASEGQYLPAAVESLELPDT